jgi:hypothetical protein
MYVSLRGVPHPERRPLHLRAKSKVEDPALSSGNRDDEAISNTKVGDYFAASPTTLAQLRGARNDRVVFTHWLIAFNL